MNKKTAFLGFLLVSQAWSLAISEFLPDPRQVPDEAGEYVEVCATGMAGERLRGWMLGMGSEKPQALKDTLLAAGACMVLARSDSAENGGFRTGQILSSGWSLANAAGSLRLWDPQGNLVDSLGYGTGWNLRSGVALERRDRTVAAFLPGNWGASTARFGAGDMGTPGVANSLDTTAVENDAALERLLVREDSGAWLARLLVRNQGRRNLSGRTVSWTLGGEELGHDAVDLETGDSQVVLRLVPAGAVPGRARLRARLESDDRASNDVQEAWLWTLAGKILFSEIQAAPRDGLPQWIEVGQGLAEPFDLAGWSLGSGQQWGMLGRNAVLPASGQLVLSSDCSALRAAWEDADLPCADVDGWPRLARGEDVLVLRDRDGRVVDSLAWSSRFWGNWPGNRTRERVARDRPSTDSTNWRSSTDSVIGSPGAGISSAPGWNRPGEDGFSWSWEQRSFDPEKERMRARLRGSGVLNAELFDLERRGVRHLWAGPLPASGVLEWDGTDDRGRRLPLGAYVLWLEVVQENGVVRRRREWVILGGRR